jgi:transcriptional regulator GlxA family with amidase domain
VIVRRPLKIALFGPPKSRVLQLAGPWEVFSRANDLLAEKHANDKPGYQFELITMDRSGFIECFDGLRIQAKHFHSLNPNVDTLLVGGSMDKDDRLPGPRAVWELPKDEEFFDWLRVASAKARRVVAIGSGAFFLAGAGLLGGRRVTTHWRWVERLQRSYPSILVDPQPVFVRDGKFFTSAGVSVTIDLSLALVEEDYGHEVATEVARRLVIFVNRPGEQAQISRALILQGADHDRFRELGVWISNHLEDDLSVETLSKRSAMSVRNFARRFRESFGITPAEFVTRVRVEAACRCLEESTLTMEQIATQCGFSSAELLRRACHRILGHSPRRFRDRNSN